MKKKVVVVTLWVKTDRVEQVPIDRWLEGADTAEWLATANIIQRSKFFTDRKELKW
jgi:hypothetical protein